MSRGSWKGAFLLTALLTIGCGSHRVSLPPDKADYLAHVALPSRADLPGSGWRVASNDEFPSGEYAHTPACEKARQADEAFHSALDERFSGQAAEMLLRQQPPKGFVGIVFWVRVFSTDRDLSRQVAAIRSYRSDLGFADCLADTTGSPTERMVPSGPIPSHGYAESHELAGAQPTLRVEVYGWQFGNVLAEVRVTGTPDAVTPEVVTAAIKSLRAGLNRAAGVDFEPADLSPTPAPQTSRTDGWNLIDSGQEKQGWRGRPVWPIGDGASLS